MKRLLTMLLMAVMFVSAYAQDEAEHMTFMGVPIDGPLDEFVNKMKQKGFTYLKEDNGLTFMKGDFTIYNDCKLLVSSPEASDDVCCVVVVFPPQQDWASLEADYDWLKSMLTKKYGEPANSIEEFGGFLPPITDSDKMYKLQNNECQWKTIFYFPNGRIDLSIEDSGNMLTNVYLYYYDEINMQRALTDAMDDL